MSNRQAVRALVRAGWRTGGAAMAIRGAVAAERREALRKSLMTRAPNEKDGRAEVRWLQVREVQLCSTTNAGGCVEIQLVAGARGAAVLHGETWEAGSLQLRGAAVHGECG